MGGRGAVFRVELKGTGGEVDAVDRFGDDFSAKAKGLGSHCVLGGVLVNETWGLGGGRF